MPRLSVAWVMLQRVPRTENLDAGLAVLLQEQRAPPALRGPDRRHQTRGAWPGDNDVKHRS